MSTVNLNRTTSTYNTERGRITNTGLWGIATTTPNSKLHVNSTTSQDPLRVQVNNSTKLLVHRGGGVSVGLANVPPANGLLVSGSVGIGTVTPGSGNKLHVVNSATYGTGIYSFGNTHGLAAEANQTGVYAKGGNEGIFAYSLDGYGVNGRSNNGYGGYLLSVNGPGLYATTFNGTYAAIFGGSIYASGTYQSSDKNIKKNIQEVGNAMSIINKLKPKFYEFRDDGKYAGLHLPKGNHYGLLAQDVEEVLPDLVKESAHEIRDHKSLAAIKSSTDSKTVLPTINREPKETINIKAVNYTELIPIVIKGVQEQQQTIQEQAKIIQQQQEEINAFKGILTKLEAALGSGKYGSTEGLNSFSLHQNYPNPFKGTTTFTYSIPKGASGKILVYDSTGKLVKTLAASDAGQVQLDATGLSAGTYVYSLIVNGELVGSKQMVLTK